MDAHDLAGIPLFDELSRKERERIAQLADVVEVKAGYHLLEQGAFPREFFVVLEGTVSVVIDGEQVAELGPNDFFGEISMLDESERRTATCLAVTPVKAAVMAVREFGEMRAEMPEVAAKLEAAALERMKG